MSVNVDSTDIVVLCGGQGNRLREVISDVPKVMAPVGGAPFLDILINYFKAQGAGRFVLCTGYKADIVEDYYRDRFSDAEVVFSRENEPLGTGGGMKNAKGFIRSDPFLVMNGDSFCPVRLDGLLGFHEEKGSMASLAVVRCGDSKDYGGISLDETGRILSFDEKTGSKKEGYVNAGVYCFSGEVFLNMPQGSKFMFEYDCFPEWTGKGIYGCVVDAPLIDIGTPERYEQAKAELKDCDVIK